MYVYSTPNDLIHLGAEKGCVLDPTSWFAYREARNITSHAYDEAKAESIYALLPAFARDARFLLTALQAVNYETAKFYPLSPVEGVKFGSVIAIKPSTHSMTQGRPEQSRWTTGSGNNRLS